jgi:hypothetical protein
MLWKPRQKTPHRRDRQHDISESAGVENDNSTCHVFMQTKRDLFHALAACAQHPDPPAY